MPISNAFASKFTRQTPCSSSLIVFDSRVPLLAEPHLLLVGESSRLPLASLRRSAFVDCRGRRESTRQAGVFFREKGLLAKVRCPKRIEFIRPRRSIEWWSSARIGSTTPTKECLLAGDEASAKGNLLAEEQVVKGRICSLQAMLCSRR